MPDEHIISVQNKDDVDQVERTFHRCPAGAKNEDDVLEFPVGLYGMQYASGDLRSFRVPAQCPACHDWAFRRFRWALRQFYLPS
jgi:hypothetical protein